MQLGDEYYPVSQLNTVCNWRCCRNSSWIHIIELLVSVYPSCDSVLTSVF